jgi:hypothetical protein
MNCEDKKVCCVKFLKPAAMVLTGIVFAYGLVFIGQQISNGLTHFRSFDRYITVKGLATKDVEADLAVWPITFNVTSETLVEAEKNLSNSDKVVRSFLAENGIAPEQIRLQNINVVDKKAQTYNSGGDMTLRFIIFQTLIVRTNNVEAMIKASQNISELVKNGVSLGDPNGMASQAPRYIFTKLNDVKPELIAEATKNARASAAQFAKDSEQEIGSIRTANQGTIQIDARDLGVVESESPQKSVRVVTTIDYLLGK